MEAGRVSDFSVERLLGHKPRLTALPADGYLHVTPGAFTLDAAGFRSHVPPPPPQPHSLPGPLQHQLPGPPLSALHSHPGPPQQHPLPVSQLSGPHPLPVPLPVPVPASCLQYRHHFYPHGLHHADFYSNPAVCLHFSSQDARDAPSLGGFHGYQQAGGAHAQLRQKSRMRTVFTDAQAKRLEALFALTDYPAAQARAEVARSTGLSEETVRVWFKNRRARRKRQRCSKVKSPSPPRDKVLFTSVL